MTADDDPNTADLLAGLTDLLPVLRELNRTSQLLAAAMPGPGHPDANAPDLAEALEAVNAAIDDYCAVSLEHSNIFGPTQ